MATFSGPNDNTMQPNEYDNTKLRDNAEFELLRSAYERRLRSFAEAIKEALKQLDRKDGCISDESVSTIITNALNGEKERQLSKWIKEATEYQVRCDVLASEADSLRRKIMRLTERPRSLNTRNNESLLERLSPHFVHNDGEDPSFGVLASIKRSADKSKLERETIEEESRLVELVATLESARAVLSKELDEERQRREQTERSLAETRAKLESATLEYSREADKSLRLTEELRVVSDRYASLVADTEKSQRESCNATKEMKRELDKAEEYTINLKMDNEKLNRKIGDLEEYKTELEERAITEKEQLKELRDTLSAISEREAASLAKLTKAESRLASCEAKLSGSVELVRNLREQLGKVEARDYEREGKLACLERRENKLQKRLTQREEHLLKLKEQNDQLKKDTVEELKLLSKLAQEMRQEFKDVRHDIGKEMRMTEEWTMMKMDGLIGLLSHHRKAVHDQARTMARVNDADRRSYDANNRRLEHELKYLGERAEDALAKQKNAEKRLEEVLEAIGLGVLVPDPDLIRRTFQKKIADITNPFEAKIFELKNEKGQLERELKDKLKALTRYHSKIRELTEKSDCLHEELQAANKALNANVMASEQIEEDRMAASVKERENREQLIQSHKEELEMAVSVTRREVSLPFLREIAALKVELSDAIAVHQQELRRSEVALSDLTNEHRLLKERYAVEITRLHELLDTGT